MPSGHCAGLETCDTAGLEAAWKPALRRRGTALDTYPAQAIGHCIVPLYHLYFPGCHIIVLERPGTAHAGGMFRRLLHWRLQTLLLALLPTFALAQIGIGASLPAPAIGTTFTRITNGLIATDG